MPTALELRDEIAAVLAERPHVSAAHVWRLLQQRGVTVSARQVRRHVSALRRTPEKPPPRGVSVDLARIGVSAEEITDEVLVALALSAYRRADQLGRPAAMVSAVRVLAAVRGEEVAEAEAADVDGMLAEIRELRR